MLGELECVLSLGTDPDRVMLLAVDLAVRHRTIGVSSLFPREQLVSVRFSLGEICTDAICVSGHMN
jgi:hypothetical protein